MIIIYEEGNNKNCNSSILFLVALIVPLESQLINNGLFVISYLIVGLEIVLKAIRNIFKGKVFDENFLMAIAIIGAFVIGDILKL